MFADITKFVAMTHHHMSMLDGDAAPGAKCALPNTPLVPSNMLGGYFCPSKSDPNLFRYVQGEGETLKREFGPSSVSKVPQFCSIISSKDDVVACTNFVPCRDDLKVNDLQTMSGGSCGLLA